MKRDLHREKRPIKACLRELFEILLAINVFILWKETYEKRPVCICKETYEYMPHCGAKKIKLASAMTGKRDLYI